MQSTAWFSQKKRKMQAAIGREIHRPGWAPQRAGLGRGPGLRCRVASAPSKPTSGPAPSSDPSDSQPSTSGRVSQYVRPDKPTYAPPSIKDTGTLKPPAEWFPAWMKYRSREDNYVFWQDKFSRNSLDITWYEKRWTVFSTFWYLIMQTQFYGIPPALRYLVYLGWRAVMNQAYSAHKALVLWQCKLDAHLAAKATDGQQQAFSKTMALRRLHWRNTLLAEALYLVNVAKTGRIHLLPPKKKPLQRPTFFWLF